ncbi:MAG: ComEC/Rec2 family competence protein [Acidimicrobiia bacterium]
MCIGTALAYAMTRRRSLLLLAGGLLAGIIVGHAADGRAAATQTAEIPDGRVTITAVALSDPAEGYSLWVLVKPLALWRDPVWSEWHGPTLLVRGVPDDVLAGETLLIDGSIEPRSEVFRGRSVGGVMTTRSATRLGAASNPLLAFGNIMRRHVLGSLDAATRSPPGALLAGFLIGDVSRLPDEDRGALRAAGLSHFVAVSGSNVALFLGAWWIASAPLRFSPRQRAAFGIVGIAIFAVITRWEPSVVRASVMAALVLIGRWAGRPVTPWTAFGGAVALSLVVAPDLTGDFGFGLSVAATGGIIAGGPLWAGRRPRPVWAVLGATISAQAAVAPLLLLWFGSIPLMAPVTNLLAAPVVALSTAVGGMGAVLHLGFLVRVGSMLASLVLMIARTAAELPQLDLRQTVALAVPAVAALRFDPLRPVLLGVVALILTISIVPARPPGVPTVHFLDVGQGDATLFVGPSGETVLVDGGPDPGVLRSHLREFGIRRIDLLIISHRHADHTTGIVGLSRLVSVGMVWYPPQLGHGSPLDALVGEFRTVGVPVSVPRPGDAVRIGAFTVAVLGPLRVYAGPNDGSLVVEVRSGAVSVLMSGDIETHAQRDLGPLRRDVLKVPHQGAATSDLGWLTSSAPVIAVISVGSNDYGHPSERVVEALESAGSHVIRTDLAGTITIPFDRVHEMATGLPSAS